MYSILIVDDEPILCRATEALIRRTGLPFSDIASASDGVEAIELLGEKKFDILIIDICMPRMNGLELCKYLYSKSPNVYLIILSGHEEFEYAQEALRYGVKDYLLKPIVPASLKDTLNKAISEIEEHSRVFSISFSQIEEIVTLFENSIWNANIKAINSALKRTDELLKDIAFLPAATICKEIIELLNGRISLKLGVSVHFKNNDYFNITRDELTKNFAGEIYSINDEVISIKHNLKLNILQKALEIINEQYNTEISLNTLADSIGYNASYLSHLFKKITGETFIQYKNHLRLENAAKLLESSDLSITEIAMKVGYGDTSYFVQVFKKYYDETPKNYRNRTQGAIK